MGSYLLIVEYHSNHQTLISTMSGNISASLYPLKQSGPMSHIDVRCMSGFASTILHPYVPNPQGPLRALSADFRGSSSQLKVRFPSTWEGEVLSHLTSGRVRYQWPGLRILKDGPGFRATNGNGPGKLNIQGNSMDVELLGETAPGLPNDEGVRQGGQPVPVAVPVAPGVPDLHTEAEVRGERIGDDDDDDWTIVGDEDGAQEATRNPPPSYDDAMTR